MKNLEALKIALTNQRLDIKHLDDDTKNTIVFSENDLVERLAESSDRDDIEKFFGVDLEDLRDLQFDVLM